LGKFGVAPQFFVWAKFFFPEEFFIFAPQFFPGQNVGRGCEISNKGGIVFPKYWGPQKVFFRKFFSPRIFFEEGLPEEILFF